MGLAGTSQIQDQQDAALERALIDEFLHKTGHTLCTIQRLPFDQQRTLLRAASTFAAIKLAEIALRERLDCDVSARP
jgi:hypothetical protein